MAARRPQPVPAHQELHSVFADQDDCLVVAAIDFGTTFSGYAFSVKGDAGEIIANKNWGNSVGMTSFKTPTCVLTKVSANGVHKFMEFGFDAEDGYARRLVGPERDETCMFNKFKMKLHREENPEESTTDSTPPEPVNTITDKRGRQTDSVSIFVMALKFMKDHLLKALNDLDETNNRNISVRLVRWVVTVPAIWTDTAKSFMRTAAHQAGLIDTPDSDHLLIALEPEAASMYCKSLRLNHFVGEVENKDLHMNAGTVYMVVDAGGGTVDITVHEVLPTGEVAELCVAKGGAWGGTNIDATFHHLLTTMWGVAFVDHLQRECPSLVWEIERQFERVKRIAKPDNPDDFPVFSVSMKMAKVYKEMVGKDITDIRVPGVHINDEYQFVLAKTRVDEMFQDTIKNILACIDHLLGELDMNIGYMFMVGGLSNSPYLNQAMKRKFGSRMKILIPENPEMAILMGAVMFGENPNHITTRVSRRTYGVRTQVPFDHVVHAADKKVVIEEQEKCVDVFHTFIKKGEAVDIDRRIIQGFFPERSSSTSVGFRLLAANKKEVKYSDERDAAIENIGDLSLAMPDTTKGKKRYVEFTMQFGGTEIVAMAKDRSVMEGGREERKVLQFVTDQRQIPIPGSEA